MHAELRDRRGSGEPLLYVPGIDGTGDYLLGTEARLAERFEVLSLRYRSDDEENTYAGLANDVARILSEQGLDSALVVAESFGVAVALQLALDHAACTRGLLLVNGFARFEQRARLALTRALAPLVTPRLFALGRPMAARLGLFGKRREDGALQAFLATDAEIVGLGYRQRLAMIRRLDLLPRLHELKLPVAIVASDEDRVVPSIAAGRAMAERIEGATLEVLPRAGHLVLPLEGEPWPERVQALAARAAAP